MALYGVGLQFLLLLVHCTDTLLLNSLDFIIRINRLY